MNAFFNKPELVAPCFVGFKPEDMSIQNGLVNFALVSGCVSIKCSALLDVQVVDGDYAVTDDDWISFEYEHYSVDHNTIINVVSSHEFSHVATGQVLSLTDIQVGILNKWLEVESFEIALKKELPKHKLMKLPRLNSFGTQIGEVELDEELVQKLLNRQQFCIKTHTSATMMDGKSGLDFKITKDEIALAIEFVQFQGPVQLKEKQTFVLPEVSEVKIYGNGKYKGD